MEAIGEVIRIDRPEPSFGMATGQENRALPATRYKSDYYAGSRKGQKGRIWRRKDNPDEFISNEEWKQLADFPEPDPIRPIEAPKPSAGERLFGKSQVLSEAEIRELREPFIEALKDIGGYTDQGLWLLNPAEKGNDIWGDLTDIEAGLLAKHLFKLGQKSPVVAVAIRETVHLKDYAALAAIIVPRVRKTKKLVDSAPPRPRRKRSLFRVVEGTTA